MPPGRVGQAHRHPSFVLAYVLEGEILTKISDQPETTNKVGQMFYEWPGQHVPGLRERKQDSAGQAASDDLRPERFDFLESFHRINQRKPPWAEQGLGRRIRLF